MFDRETTKGMTEAEYVSEIYIGLLDIPAEELEGFFEEAGELVKKQLSQRGYEYFEDIKTYVISRRMKEAHN